MFSVQAAYNWIFCAVMSESIISLSPKDCNFSSRVAGTQKHGRVSGYIIG